MILLLVFIYFICFCVLAWKNISLAIAFLIVFLPAYLIRFNIGPIPSTILEINFFAIFLVWFVKYAKNDYENITATIKQHKYLFIFILILLVSAFVSCFLHPIPLRALAIWRAYFLQPIIFFIIIVGQKNHITPKSLIKYLLITSIGISLLAIIQKITGQFYPPGLWNDELFGRVTSFFTSPNAVGLFLAPVFLLSLPLLRKQNALAIANAIVALIAIFFTLSHGTWAALIAGIVIYLFFIDYKKTAISIAIFCTIAVLTVPAIKSTVLFEDQSGQNRLVLWQYSTEYLTATPKNFFLGAGLRRFFHEVQKPHYDVRQMERLIYPHNIFLNFWLETGLLGMMAFGGIIICLIFIIKNISNKNFREKAALFAVIGAVILHGLVDAPYFKNDLAMLFWIITAIILLSEKKLSAQSG